MSASPLVKFDVDTHARTELVNVTGLLQRAVQEAGVAEGILIATVLHTTAGLTINENADPDVGRDLLACWGRWAPERGDYRHAEGNSDAHIKASLVGATVTLPVAHGRLVLGTWQGIFLCEFDGPRRRTLCARLVS